MTRFFVCISFLIISLITGVFYAQTARYELRMENPANHYFQVDFFLTDYKTDEIEVKMPVWAPGSYLVREFSKNLNEVRAYDESGKQLEIIKKSKNAWVVKRGKAKEVKVSYEVYSFELTVRTSFLDRTHGFVRNRRLYVHRRNKK